MSRLLSCSAVLILLAAAAAQAPPEHAVVIREAYIYLTPDTSATKIATLERGRDLAILAKSHDWVQVFASVTRTRDVTGWMLDKGVVRQGAPAGDAVIFGEAADCENEASQRTGRKGAAEDAMRLYARLAEYFPNSPLAAEAAWRSADIRWQLERADALTRPSAREQDPSLHVQIDEEQMRDVIKKYPRTRQADLAAYELIDNKLCGEWLAQAKCPERETEIYEKYAGEHPQSPKAPEALYNAAWRQGALIDIYRANEDARKSEGARARAAALCQRLITQFPQSDWALRAQRLLYMVQQGISIYGGGVE